MKSGAFEVNESTLALTSPTVPAAKPQTIQQYMEWIHHLEKRARLMEKNSSKTDNPEGESKALQPKRRLRSSGRIVAISASRPHPYSPWTEQPSSVTDQGSRLVV